VAYRNFRQTLKGKGKSPGNNQQEVRANILSATQVNLEVDSSVVELLEKNILIS
jgi:hypothetical protein